MLPETSQETREPAVDLLEARRIARDFRSPAGKIRVETRIRVNRIPWSLRTVVLRDGVEVKKRPFAPLEEEQDASRLNWQDLAQAQLDFARRALQRHEKLCRDVETDLASPQGGILARGGLSLDLKDLRAGLIIGAVVIFLAVLLGLVLFLKPKPQSRPKAQAKPVQTEAQRPPKKSEEEKPLPDSATGQKPAWGKRPVEKERPKPPHQKQPNKPIRGERSPAAEATLIGEFDPPRYLVGHLAPGKMAYVDTDATFVEVPRAYEGLSCIRTANEDRTAKRSLGFNLTHDARVYVAHDRRINKKPKWLKSQFSPTSERLVLNGPLASGVVELDLFVGEFSAGRVVLGPNTEWTSWTRAFRDRFPKDLVMYVVCVSPE